MKFGPVAVADSLGVIVAHTLRVDDLVLKKGAVVSADNVARLQAAGVAELVAARLEDGDVAEDAAADRLARVVAGANVRVEKAFTGRANLFAEAAGVLLVDTDVLDAVNDVDETLTFATLPRWRAVEAGEMIGTVKVIPFAVRERVLQAAIAAATRPPLAVAAFQPLRIGVISTLLPGLKPATIAKTLRVMAERLAPMGAAIEAETRTPHTSEDLKTALEALAPQVDLVVVFGASAITDRRDVIPAALEAAGGVITHLGMPVDPGNLLLVGALDGKPVLGAPGCARSPKENGFDWVLQRLVAGLDVTSADIKRMGAGGLLMEIVQRGQPRLPESGDDA